MAMDENKIESRQYFTTEEFNELSSELWNTFRTYKGKAGNDNKYSRAAAQAAIGIIQLQAYKPPEV